MKDHHRMRAWDEKYQEYINPLYPTEPPIPEQYIFELCTGLRDKNGGLVYDGDILNLYGYTALVSWSEKELCYTFSLTDERGPTTLYGDEVRSKHVEVIGNIHQNPELLTEQE